MSERNGKSKQYRVAGGMVAAFLIVLGIGCTKADTNQADTSGRGTTVDTTDLSAEDPGLDDVPGRDQARTREYLQVLNQRWTTRPESVTVDCEKDDCDGNARTVHLFLYTHERTWQINAKQILDENEQNIRGHIVLKLVNRDNFKYRPLGIPGHDSAYLWVGKTAGRKAFAVFQIDSQGNANALARAYRAIRCVGRPDSSSQVHVRPRDSCEDGRTFELLYSHTDIMPPSLRDTTTPHPGQPFHESGLWFTCTGGCCQANSFSS